MPQMISDASPDPPDEAIESPNENRAASAATDEIKLQHEARPAPHDPYEAWRYRDYRLFISGWILSVIGSQMLDVAVQMEIFRRLGGDITRGSTALGLAGGVQAAPLILLALPAGQLADKFDRQKIITISSIAAAACACALAVVSYTNAPIGWVYLLLGLAGVAQAIGWPARAALLPRTVPTAAFSNAATWMSSAFQIASVTGPVIGGLVIALGAGGRLGGAHAATGGAGTAVCYGLTAVCSLSFCIFLALMSPSAPAGPSRRRAGGWAGFIAGVEFVQRDKLILATITLDLFAVLLGGAVYLLPIFAEKRLGVGAVGFGLLRAAPAVGALAMAMVVAHQPPMRHAGRSLLWSVAGFGVATIVFGFSRSFVLSMIALAFTGAFDNISVIIRHTLVQLRTPDEMRGRVSAVNNIFIGASNELGGMESGLTAGLFGPVASVIGGGIGTLLVVAVVAMIWPQVRKLGKLHEPAPEAPAQNP